VVNPGELIFPGATAISGLSVYQWQAEDGRCGGSPHVHLTCTEAYVTVSGEGSLQTLTVDGLQEVPLSAGTAVWFGPGTVHRAINGDGELRVIVIMQNSGLPEAGDAVLTYPPEILDDPELYQAPRTPRNRRDLAVQGFLALAEDVEAGGGRALERFYRQATALVADRLDDWEARWRSGPAEAARRTGEQIAALRSGRIDHLLSAGVRTMRAPDPDSRRYGMCGMLDVYPLGTP
jgi:mannose-6-phosphate isomerase-like protein (cupin superfamily)